MGGPWTQHAGQWRGKEAWSQLSVTSSARLIEIVWVKDWLKGNKTAGKGVLKPHLHYKHTLRSTFAVGTCEAVWDTAEKKKKKKTAPIVPRWPCEDSKQLAHSWTLVIQILALANRVPSAAGALTERQAGTTRSWWSHNEGPPDSQEPTRFRRLGIKRMSG